MKAIEAFTSPATRTVSDPATRFAKPLLSHRHNAILVDGMEPFIDAAEAATFVKLHRKTLLHLAREGSIPAHPLTGNRRRVWRFLVSELDAWARSRVNCGLRAGPENSRST
jgi:excisionase family DNA binding protein